MGDAAWRRSFRVCAPRHIWRPKKRTRHTPAWNPSMTLVGKVLTSARTPIKRVGALRSNLMGGRTSSCCAVRRFHRNLSRFPYLRGLTLPAPAKTMRGNAALWASARSGWACDAQGFSKSRLPSRQACRWGFLDPAMGSWTRQRDAACLVSVKIHLMSLQQSWMPFIRLWRGPAQRQAR